MKTLAPITKKRVNTENLSNAIFQARRENQARLSIIKLAPSVSVNKMKPMK